MDGIYSEQEIKHYSTKVVINCLHLELDIDSVVVLQCFKFSEPRK